MADAVVGVLGARGLVGPPLLSRLEAGGLSVVAFTRSDPPAGRGSTRWRRLHAGDVSNTIPEWISVAPIWTLPEHFDLLVASGARRLVALSSTSRYTKDSSSDPSERALAEQLAVGEDRVQEFARARGISVTILRPTLIYGFGRDRNICAITRFVHRFRFFPLAGDGSGLRQPVHAREVAAACVEALHAANTHGRAYDISGGEVVSYREMVRRVFIALGRSPRFATIPMPLARLTARAARLFPGYRHLSIGMIERMNRDLSFAHDEAAHDFAYAPGPFIITANDLPRLDTERS